MITLDILLLDSRDFPDYDHLAATLSPSCHARLVQLQINERRRQFVLGRWLMAQAAECELAQITENKTYPVYAGQASWHASISHSGPYIAVVFSDQARFGLDIEYPTRHRDWLALAKRAFAGSEFAWVAAAPIAQQSERFHRIWTLREAAFKAGFLPLAVSSEAVFDPASGQACGDFCWQYLQYGDLHLSVVGPCKFTATIRDPAGSEPN